MYYLVFPFTLLLIHIFAASITWLYEEHNSDLNGQLHMVCWLRVYRKIPRSGIERSYWSSTFRLEETMHWYSGIHLFTLPLAVPGFGFSTTHAEFVSWYLQDGSSNSGEEESPGSFNLQIPDSWGCGIPFKYVFIIYLDPLNFKGLSHKSHCFLSNCFEFSPLFLSDTLSKACHSFFIKKK